jgi:hypothetical protein
MDRTARTARATIGSDCFGFAERPLKAIELAPETFISLLRCFGITPSTDQLGFLGFDGEHVARVVFDESSILVLEFLNLGYQLGPVMSSVFDLFE